MPPKAAADSSFSISQDAIEIKPADLAKPLGKGGFGVVYKGLYHGALVAVKQLLLEDAPPRQLAEFVQEAEVMAKLHYPHIIQLYGFTNTRPYRIVMEFMPQGSLFKILHNEADLSWQQRITWGIEIGAGLHYLHSLEPQIIHRDLKSLNVLVGVHNEAKLTDFGLALAKLRTATTTLTSSSSSRPRKSEEPTGPVGSIRWMAPELFVDLEPTYNQATDIFAYAIVLWELAAREIPYPTVQKDSIIESAVQTGKRASIKQDWPEAFKSLMARCWDQTPRNRPSAKEAVKTLQAALLELGGGASAASAAVSRLAVKRDYAAGSSTVKESRGYALESELSAKANVAAQPAAAAASPARPQTAGAATAFFAPAAAKPTVDQAAVEKLLQHVARGEQEQAEAMLKVKGNETLLLHKGRVTDYSNRTFNSITAFQYALWALDWHMWKMILKYLPREEAAHQLQELESSGPGPGNADHGKQYDFTPLIKALKTYVDQFDALYKAQKYDVLESHWIKGVGGAQCHVPAHVANEYCRRDRSFYPKPTFTEADLPRTFDLYSDNKFFPLSKYSWGALSSDFSIYRRAQGWPGAASTFSFSHDSIYLLNHPADLIAITGLCEVRTGQYQELKRELTAQLAARPR